LLLTEQNDENLKSLLEGQPRLWLLRILVSLQGFRAYLEDCSSGESVINALLGRDEPIDTDDKNECRRAFQALRKLHQAAEQKSARLESNRSLANNLRQLGELVGLSATDRRLMEFLVVFTCNSLLSEAGEALGEISTLKLQHILAVVLGLPEAEIKASLSPRGILEQSGLLRVDRSAKHTMDLKFQLLSENFADYMFTEEQDPVTILRDSVAPGRPPTLQLADFAHLGQILVVVQGHLRRTLADGKTGSNIFLHGPPGTGKTELARVLAGAIGQELFEVASEDSDGHPIDAIKRLRALRAAQNIFARRPVILLFDEAEDVFNDGGFFSPSTAATHKAWLNRMLEENRVPTLWLSNSTRLDPAFVRRFDMVLELPVPPRRRREELLREICGDLLSPGARARIAAADFLAPAVLRRAMAVLDNISDELPEMDRGTALETLIDNTLTVQGHRPLPKGNAGLLPADYDLRYLQADIDLEQTAAGLAASRSGRLCFYGPPGTGKSAFVQWLARRLDAPLHLHRCSDIISKWVGETEQNMAKAFREAERDRAVLLIDEVDSFLQDRRDARHSWEITAVNEMLTQMESFNGIFIASTNLLDGLDQAALRRFDLKIRFTYLAPQQSWPLFLSHCRSLGLPKPAAKLKHSVANLNLVTPGDFAAVARRHKFHPLTTPAALLAALTAECALKEEGRCKSIGFV